MNAIELLEYFVSLSERASEIMAKLRPVQQEDMQARLIKNIIEKLVS